MKRQPSDKAIVRALAAHVRESPGTCPDDNVLAAYLEFRLGTTERQRLEAHAAVCSSCQEILGLAMRIQPEESADTTRTEAAGGRRVLFRLSVPVSLLALVAVGVTVAVLTPRLMRKGGAPKAADQIVESRPARPAQASPTLPASAKETERLSKLKPEPAPVEPRPRIGVPRASTAAKPAAASTATEPLAIANQTGAPFVTAPASPTAAIIAADKPGEAPRAEGAQMKGSEVALPFQQARTALGETSVSTKAELTAANKSKDYTREPARADANRQLGATDKKVARAENVSTQAVTSERAATSVLRAGDKTFRRVGDSLVDLEALAHPEAPSVELAADSKEFVDIVTKLNEVNALLQPGRTLTIHWQGKNYVLRR